MLKRLETARSVRLHLFNGAANGIVSANSGRGVIAFRAPRARLRELCSRDEANRKGIYLLSGSNPEDSNRQELYIGESDCIRLRVPFQERNLEFFDHVAVAVAKDDNLSKDHCRFIESELIRMARAAGLANVVNGNDPRFDRLSESDRLEAEDFLEELLLLLPILNFDIFRPVSYSLSDSEGAPTFETQVSGAHALAHETDDGFVVLADSTARLQLSESFPQAIGMLRQSLLREGKLQPATHPNYLRFTENVRFSSPSAAATLVAGRSASGPQEWKIRGEKQTYKEWREAQHGL